MRALQKASVPNGRLAACWFANSFTVDVNLTDNNAHQVALYFVDWDSLGRSNRVDILDASSGTVLDTRTVSNFTSGQYWIWNLSGHVTIRVTAVGTYNAVVSGLFFGGSVVAAQSPAATSAFVKTDTTTLGSWKGVYGSEGSYVINDGTSPIPYGTVSPSANSQYTWAASTTDLRALQKSSVPNDRLAACWFANSFTVDVKFSDSNVHQVALYFVDWDSLGRSNRVDILDASSGTVLDTRTISQFTSGQYWIWNLSGHVTIRLTAVGGSNAVLSGLFFGAQASAPKPPASPVAFLQTDTTTLGSWKGVYGSEGYYVINDGTSPISYGTITPSGYSQYTWDLYSSDMRALQKASVPNGRLAACWFANSFTVDVNLTDNKVHQVALYFLDWDSLGRINRVDILDASSGNVLDSQTVSNFTSGQYWIWNLSGHVTIRVTAVGARNAVVSGIFFGGK
jgi:hypothetical protein